ncbi:acyl carrier protein [Streptomyces sp. PG2]
MHRRIVDIVASRTLYEESYLQPDSHFEADLGIDSVILESILASVNEDFALSPPLTGDPTTIRELVDGRAARPGGRRGGRTGGRPGRDLARRGRDHGRGRRGGRG